MTLPTSHRAEALDPFAGRRLRLTAADHYNLTSDSQHESSITTLDSVYTAKRAIADNSAISKQRARAKKQHRQRHAIMAEEYSDIKFEIKGQIGIIKVRPADAIPALNRRFFTLTSCSSTDPRR